MAEIKGMVSIVIKIFLTFLCVDGVIIFMDISDMSSTKEMLETVGFYVIFCNMLVLLSFAISVITTYLRVYISFGAMRKDIFKGKNIVSMGLIVVLSIVNVSILLMTRRCEIEKIIYIIAASILMSAMGGIVAVIIDKFGVIGYIIVCFSFGAIGTMCGLYLRNNIKHILTFPSICVGFLILSFVIYAASEYIQWKIIKNYEIRV